MKKKEIEAIENKETARAITELSTEELEKLFYETPLSIEKLEAIDTQLNAVEKKLLWILSYLQKLKLRDYLLLMERPTYLMWINFLGGVARGVGIAIGFTVLGAVAVIILQRMEVLNLPFIGHFISELLTYIDVNTGINVIR